jgi:hypothetical protein
MARRKSPPALSLIGLSAVLAGCSPIYETKLPNGYYTVTSYSRLYGISGAQSANITVALRKCPNGFVLVDEQFGTDADGLYRRWTYDCVLDEQRAQSRGDGRVTVGPQSRRDGRVTVGPQSRRDGRVTVGPIEPRGRAEPEAAR